ncbi:MAG TPA: GNAT family N-acetyltransferase, partial [Pyrinomonadaceae bacterium]|nr:GNAT family N-acetyltransferase [Pyrinomonadaceae bacterium]
CGLLKREELADVDIGFAFLPDFWNQGFAWEAAAAVMKYGQETLQLKRIAAITNPDNDASIKLLQRLGFTFERVLEAFQSNGDVKLFVFDAAAS